jgi:hypothetical protein
MLHTYPTTTLDFVKAEREEFVCEMAVLVLRISANAKYSAESES